MPIVHNTITRTNLRVGLNTFGPYTLPKGATSLTVTLTRTINGGIDSLPSTAHIQISWYVSINSGPFRLLASGGTRGGTVLTPTTGQPTNQTFLKVAPLSTPTATRQVRATVTTTTRVAVAGSYTFS